ncbi:MAG: hypothetical protein VX498_01415, partial [Myxococcota bacterium]|nr:hypothetical protein [Myxococcota bacterium]
MASIDHGRRRISAVLLFYGAENSGRTTSLYALARQLPAGTRGKVAPLAQSEGRLLRLDYRPHDEELVLGYQVNFRLISVVGPPDLEFLAGVIGAVDAVMFVADSSRSAATLNLSALKALEEVVQSSGRPFASVPKVFLYNKQDVRDPMDIETLQASLNPGADPHVAASAIRGQGVLDGLHRLTASVAAELRRDVQAQHAEDPAPVSPRTTPHGTTLQAARAIHGSAASSEGASSSLATTRTESANPWALDDDDRTDVNHGAAEAGVIPAISSDDRTSPSRPLASGGGPVAAPDDRTAPPGLRAPISGVAAPDDRTAPPGAIPASVSIASAEDLTSPSLMSVPSEVPVGAGGFSRLTPVDPDGLPQGPAEGWAEAAVDYSGAEDRTNPTTTGDPFGGAPAARLSPRQALPRTPAPPRPDREAAPPPSAESVGLQAWEAEMRPRAI